MSSINQINNVSQTGQTNVIQADKTNIIDLTLVTGLNTGDFITQQIRDVSNKMKETNRLIEQLNTIISKARIATTETLKYSKTTWNVTKDNIQLSNGYSVSFNKTNSGLQLAINDQNNNQLFFQNGVLVPTPAQTGVNALEVGIPLMSDTTLMLGDGTSITFATNPVKANEQFNQDDLSGGLASVSSIIIKRGNQSLKINDVSTGSPIIENPKLNAYKNISFNHGHVLLENGGLDSWEYNGKLVKDMTYSKPGSAEGEAIDGLFARKFSFKDSVTKASSEYDSKIILTFDEKNLLNKLNIKYSDISGKGIPTKEEWATIMENAIEKRNSLSSTSQYDFLNLQRATGKLVTHNEYLMNVFKQLFAVLKDISRM